MTRASAWPLSLFTQNVTERVILGERSFLSLILSDSKTPVHGVFKMMES